MFYSPRPKLLYKKKIIPILIKEFGYKSIMEVPKIKKIVISKGIGYALNDKKIINNAIEEISIITGQKAIPCFSKRDESGFKLRKGMFVGCKVTLRRQKMYEFIDRLITIALPRVRDFNGIKNNSFDGKGNYNLGIIEQIIFPEINIDKTKKILGMNIAFVTSAKTDKEALSLLKYFGIPFKKN
ncbi:MAG: 50S ribosomal protein L5 [Candidatus Bostrichicola ureolyticus]|nr:MAG: 50S ribosomal protein L5 [Candidatus Bostrichicola ureolyticus]